jgi:AcrR family transcriptional regulator
VANRRATTAPSNRGESEKRRGRETAEKRKEQILDAFFRCVARHGIKDSTVAHIADESGLQRTLIYHYFKDRETLIDSLIDYIMDRTRMRLFKAVSGRSTDAGPERLEELIEYFFGGGYSEAGHDDFMVFAEVVALGLRDEHTREKVNAVWRGWLRYFSHELSYAYPLASETERAAVSYALMLLAEQNAYMRNLGFSEARNEQARASAQALLSLLASSPSPIGTFLEHRKERES